MSKDGKERLVTGRLICRSPTSAENAKEGLRL